MAGIADDVNGFDVFYGDNVDFSGGFPPSAKVLLDGQLLIGSTVAPHIRVNTLTAGSNITITNSNGNIVIAGTGGGGGGGLNTLMANSGSATQVAGVINVFATSVAATGIPIQTVASGNTLTIQAQSTTSSATSSATNRGLASFNLANFSVDANGFVSGTVWTDESTNFNAASGNGYFIIGTCTATLPSSPGQGNTISFAVDAGSTAITITANAGQKIRIGSALSAVAGTALSNANGDSVTLVFRAADSTWVATSVIGTFTVT